MRMALNIKELVPVRRLPAEAAIDAKMALVHNINVIKGSTLFDGEEARILSKRAREEYRRQAPITLAGEWVLKPFWRGSTRKAENNYFPKLQTRGSR